MVYTLDCIESTSGTASNGFIGHVALAWYMIADMKASKKYGGRPGLHRDTLVRVSCGGGVHIRSTASKAQVEPLGMDSSDMLRWLGT